MTDTLDRMERYTRLVEKRRTPHIYKHDGRWWPWVWVWPVDSGTIQFIGRLNAAIDSKQQVDLSL